MKVDREVVAALKNISLFRALDESSLASIAQQMKTYRFAPGSSVIDEEASGKFGRLYSVVSGTAEARVHGETVATFGPGDSFGEMSVLDGEPRSAAVVATSELETLGLSSWNMRALLREEPEIAMSVITELVGRLRARDEEVID
jgi:CRP-like cAMP-binding protein